MMQEDTLFLRVFGALSAYVVIVYPILFVLHLLNKKVPLAPERTRAVKKNTPENRAFWDHVERVAKHVRDNPEIYAHNRVYQVKGDR